MEVRVVKHWITYPHRCYRYIPQYLNLFCGWKNIPHSSEDNDYVDTMEEAIEICKEYKNKNKKHEDKIVWEG